MSVYIYIYTISGQPQACKDIVQSYIKEQFFTPFRATPWDLYVNWILYVSHWIIFIKMCTISFEYDSQDPQLILKHLFLSASLTTFTGFLLHLLTQIQQSQRYKLLQWFFQELVIFLWARQILHIIHIFSFPDKLLYLGYNLGLLRKEGIK